LSHQEAILAVARQEFDERRLPETGFISGREKELESLSHVLGRNKDVYVGANAESRVAVK
jgi:hypothetical protein